MNQREHLDHVMLIHRAIEYDRELHDLWLATKDIRDIPIEIVLQAVQRNTLSWGVRQENQRRRDEVL